MQTSNNCDNWTNHYYDKDHSKWIASVQLVETHCTWGQSTVPHTIAAKPDREGEDTPDEIAKFHWNFFYK